MSEWKTYRLGDLCSRIKSGKGIPASEVSTTGEYPVIGGNGIRGYTNTSNFNGVCAVVGRQGAYCGNVRFFSGEAYMTEHAVVIVGNELADTRYLAYLLSIMQLGHLSAQSAQPGLSVQTLSKLSINIPDISTQRRIAGILGSLDDKIELNRRINANLEEQAQALFKSWFVDFEAQNSNPGFFNDIIQTTLSGDWGQETPKGNYTSEVYCIRGADIPDIKCGDKGKLPTRFILEKNLENKKLSENDLVVEISGGSPTQSTGRICLITRALLDKLGKDVICTNFCRALKPIPDYSFFIYLYWQYLYNNNIMFSYENGTTGIKNLNITDLINKEPIIIPKKKKILEFNNVLQSIFDMIYKNGRENEHLSALRDTLLPKLMAGNFSRKCCN